MSRTVHVVRMIASSAYILLEILKFFQYRITPKADSSPFPSRKRRYMYFQSSCISFLLSIPLSYKIHCQIVYITLCSIVKSSIKSSFFHFPLSQGSKSSLFDHVNFPLFSPRFISKMGSQILFPRSLFMKIVSLFVWFPSFFLFLMSINSRNDMKHLSLTSIPIYSHEFTDDACQKIRRKRYRCQRICRHYSMG